MLQMIMEERFRVDQNETIIAPASRTFLNESRPIIHRSYACENEATNNFLNLAPRCVSEDLTNRPTINEVLNVGFG